MTSSRTHWVELAGHTVYLLGCQTTSPSSVCNPQGLKIFSNDGFSSFDGKVHGHFELCDNHFTPLIISVTSRRFVTPEVNTGPTCTGAFLTFNGVSIVSLSHTHTPTHSLTRVLDKTMIKWRNTWCQSSTFTQVDRISARCHCAGVGHPHAGVFESSIEGFSNLTVKFSPDYQENRWQNN